jgi:hypothetical protein
MRSALSRCYWTANAQTIFGVMPGLVPGIHDFL